MISTHTLLFFLNAATARVITAGVGAFVLSGIAATLTYEPVTIAINDDFERSSVNVAASSISGSGDSAVITLRPRVQASEVTTDVTKWLEPVAKVTGINGIRPTFRFDSYGTGTAGYWGHPWASTRKAMFSYDLETFTPFDSVTVNSTYIEFRHNTAFTADTVYVSRGRLRTVTQVGNWLASLASSYPTLVSPTPSAVAFTPVNCTGWPAQSYIAAEYSTQTTELGDTVPATPLYAFKISEGTGARKTAVLTAGVHAGEDTGDLAFKESVEFLLSSDPKAQMLRAIYDFYCYPLINAPGRYGGHWRGSFEDGTGGEDDANRHFTDTVAPIEIVSKPRTAMTTDIPAGVVSLFLDFHGIYYDNVASYLQVEALPAAYDAAVEVYLGAGAVSPIAGTFTASISKWMNDNYSNDGPYAWEIGEEPAITDADYVSIAEATIKALFDITYRGLVGVAHPTRHSLLLTNGLGGSNG